MKSLLVLVFNLCAAYSTISNENTGSERIINGISADFAQFPYAISLQETAQLAAVNRGHSCGGALITYQHALTSGSCLYVVNAQGVYTLKTPAQYRVFSGAALLTNDTSNDRVRTVASFQVHPNYTGPPSTYNDVGLIVMATPFLNTTVVPIALRSDAAATPAEFTDCVAAGWGSASYVASDLNNQLMYANKYIYNQATCMVVLNPQPSAPNVLPLHVCAASYSLSASCTNDVGNVLVCGGVLTGVLSWHPPCFAETSWPDLYTRTSNYSEWIVGITGNGNRLGSAYALITFFVAILAAGF